MSYKLKVAALGVGEGAMPPPLTPCSPVVSSRAARQFDQHMIALEEELIDQAHGVAF